MRVMSFAPEYLYLTHYGRIGEVPRLGALLLQQIDAMVALAQTLASHAQRHAALKEALSCLYTSSAREHGCHLSDAKIRELLAADLELNTQGLSIWLDRAAKAMNLNA